MKSFSTLAALSATLLSLVPAVSAHGYLANFEVDGTNYVGTNPDSQTPKATVIRAIDDPSPRTDLKSDDMGCGANTADLTAPQSAPAKAGSTLTFDWKAADGSNWPHNTGPMLTYIASCGADCSNFDSKQAKWVKISQIGHEDDGKSNTWVQQEVMDGATSSITLPSDTPNGEYLVRHEIIALHRATDGVPEFYPACAQISVSGGQDGTLDESDAVSFPGTYSLKDPGLSDEPYGKTDSTYQFPGPDVQTKIASGDSSSGGDSSDAPSATTSGATATATTSSGPKATGSEGSADSGSDGNQGSSDDDGEDYDCTETDAATSATVTSAAAATQTLDISDNGDNGGVVTVTQVVTVYANADAAQSTSVTKAQSTLTVVETVTVTDSASSAAQTTSGSSDSENGDYAYRHRRSRLFYRMDLQKA